MIRQCEYCGIDFDCGEGRGTSTQRFCKTKQCQKDRKLEWTERYYQKVSKDPGYNRHRSPNPTWLRPQAQRAKAVRRRDDD